jgi:hypothetical protein
MIYSLDDTNGFKRTEDSENLYDIFKNTCVYDKNITLFKYIVNREYEMRLDLICQYLYGHTEFIEELMVINNIYNPFSIKEGDTIYYFDTEDLNLLHANEVQTENAFEKMAKFQTKKPDGTPNLSPTMKPPGMSQVINDKKSGKIRILNKLD